VPWLNGVAATNNDNEKNREDIGNVIDFTQLSDSDDDDDIDAGVTSGSDPSGWDPINIDGKP